MTTRNFYFVSYLLTFYCSIYYGLAFLILSFIKNNFSKLILIPILFVVIEILREHLGYGFPWITFASITSGNSFILNLIYYFGTYGLSYFTIVIFLFPATIVLFYKKNIKIRKKDIYKGISEKNLDLITLDLKEPWNALSPAHKALKKGAFLVIYTPQITQALSCINKIKNKFIHIKTKETAEREWRLEGKIAKPITPLISHTGFLTFLRKI